MQFTLAVVHELVKFAGLLLIAQGLVRVLSFGRHEANVVYRALRFLTSPVVRFGRMVTPRIVVERHVPLATFLLLFWAWIVLIFVRREFLAQGGTG